MNQKQVVRISISVKIQLVKIFCVCEKILKTIIINYCFKKQFFCYLFVAVFKNKMIPYVKRLPFLFDFSKGSVT